MLDPTRPEGIDFLPVSPALIRVRVIGAIITFAVLVTPSILITIFVDRWAAMAFIPITLLAVWILWLIPRRVRAMGYYEGKDEFLIVKGILFRQLTVIPYGRIQYVDVKEGPIARHYGITTIEMYTASADTAGKIEGLPAAEAARLRDALSARGLVEHAGL